MWKISLLLLFLCAAGQIMFVSAQQQNITVCDGTGIETNETCATAGNRVCYFFQNNSTESCGACQNGYIEYQQNCLNISEYNFTAFVEEYEPFYTSDLNNTVRALVLEVLVRYISEFRSQIPPPTYKLKLNKFSADTEEDAKQRTGLMPRADLIDQFPLWDINLQNNETTRRTLQTVLPQVSDWREKGAVTPVKDQGRCGCCWANALAGAIEGTVFVNEGYLQSVSFQQFISCDQSNFGCDGGNTVTALLYAWKGTRGGLSSDMDYPFTDKDGTTTTTCKQNQFNASVIIDEPRIVIDYNQDLNFEQRTLTLKAALSYVPVVGTIKSTCDTLSSYGGGVLTDDGDCACDNVGCIDHAILLVGYNDNAPIPHWIVKNSWGTDWGDDGFFLISQQPANGNFGLFGILGHAVGAVNGKNLTEAVAEPTSSATAMSVVMSLAAACGAILLLLS